MPSAINLFIRYNDHTPTIHILEIIEHWCPELYARSELQSDWYGEVVVAYGQTSKLRDMADILIKLGFAPSVIYSVGKDYADPQPKPV